MAKREEDDYGIGKMTELDAYKRMVELYQNGAVIEYHDIGKKKLERFHVGFRYDAMSDDDYFELRAIERFFKIKENSNLRGDIMKMSGMRKRTKA